MWHVSWDNQLWKAIEKHRDKNQKTMGPQSYKEPSPNRSRLKALAEEVLNDKTTTTAGVEKKTKVR